MTASATTTDREIIVTRMYDAPRELVFDAFTDPKHTLAVVGPAWVHDDDALDGLQGRR